MSLSLPRLAWRHLSAERASTAAVALALLLALLPAGLLLVETSGARADLGAILRASNGLGVQRAGIAGGAAFDAFQAQARGLVNPRLGRYTDGGSERATAGPYRLATISAAAPAPPIDAADVEVAYAGDLAERVVVAQGLLPKNGAQGAEATATMAQVAADRAGVRLFDLVCIRAPSAPADAQLWCARVVGLWRPAAGADPRWTARDAPLQLFTARDTFFLVAGLAPAPQSTGAERRYLPRPDAITPQDALATAAAVSQVRAAVAGARAGQVDSSLDADLTRYASTGDLLSLPVEMLTAALLPLLVLLALVLARWYVEPRLHDLALLRARGWAPGRVRRLVLTQFAALGGMALAAALVGVAVLAWRPGLGSPASSPGELLAALVAAAVVAVTALRFAALADWTAEQSVLRLDHPDIGPPSPVSWRGARLNSLLVLPAILLLALSRVAGDERGRIPAPFGDLAAVLVSVAGLVMLVVATLPALSLASEALGVRRTDLESTLARLQLRRWWQRHAMTGFLIVFAFAIATFAAVALADQELDRPALGRVVLGQGVAVSLGLGFVVAITAALLAYGLVFLVACRVRSDDYTTLLVDGLPASSVRRSLRIEQHIVLAGGLLTGIVLGLVLAWATSWGAIVGAPTAAGTVVGLAATAAVGLGAGATAAWLIRRSGIGFALMERGRAT
ncbi:MAG TPA: hypothetical protein VOB72_08755 [Candidatus Dormibacteraeota bacterium]|nr:hypothetical protein [Candidatus Dormibacteraeota bacterium]